MWRIELLRCGASPCSAAWILCLTRRFVNALEIDMVAVTLWLCELFRLLLAEKRRR